MDMGEKIKNRRKELNMTLEELGNIVGVSKSTVHKWEDGMITNIRRDKIAILAKALQCTPGYLMGWASDFEDSEQLSVSINILGSVAAGIPIYAIEDIIGTVDIPRQLAETGSFFALKIKGDSMSPRISNGDTVIVKYQQDAESGNIVIARIGKSEVTCKKLIKHENGITLFSFNPSYEPMNFSNEDIELNPVEIIGRVVENRSSF